MNTYSLRCDAKGYYIESKWMDEREVWTGKKYATRKVARYNIFSRHATREEALAELENLKKRGSL